MKYIVTKTEEGKEEIFIFPKSINHDCMMEALRGIRSESTGRWTRIHRKAIAAGFTDGVRCIGRSETLQLDSRGLLDAVLIDPNG
jgi:hypothetical protein